MPEPDALPSCLLQCREWPCPWVEPSLQSPVDVEPLPLVVALPLSLDVLPPLREEVVPPLPLHAASCASRRSSQPWRGVTESLSGAPIAAAVAVSFACAAV